MEGFQWSNRNNLKSVQLTRQALRGTTSDANRGAIMSLQDDPL